MNQKTNRMGSEKVTSLLWKMGLPMVFSMVLQAIYNVVDTIFVVNKEGLGASANQALTYAFPIQILMIAVGVGTGVGINALLSLNLGKGDKKMVSRTVGNGIFLAIILTLVFVLFGAFLAKPYMTFMARSVDESLYSKASVISMGTQYLQICCILSLGNMGLTVFERFLQATGKTMLSTIGQVSGALCNILLDYVFIYLCDWGVAGAAYATVIGQFLGFIMDAIFHYVLNKDVENHVKDVLPNGRTIGLIYKIGGPAAIMQALLAAMMFVTLQIIGTNSESGTLLQGSFGIYYKVMQLALFACFGLSNTLISVVSFNYGAGEHQRIRETIRWGIIDSVIVAAVITGVFQAAARPISSLFGLTLGGDASSMVDICVYAMHIATIGYVFMAVSVAIQGILQGFRDIFMPILISLLRLIIFIVPFAFLFLNVGNPVVMFWITFPVTEFLTAVISFLILMQRKKKYMPKKN